MGVIGALPFLYFSYKRVDVKFMLPALASVVLAKVYASRYFIRNMESQGIFDYWKKSKKLDSDLRNTEKIIEYRKLYEKM